LKLTDEQQAKLKEINATLATRQADLSKKRDGILTAEQRTAQAEAMQKLREGNLSRQEAADLLAAAVKLTPEQRTQTEAVDLEARQLHQEGTAQKMAVLTDEQRGILRKQTIAANVARTFSIPGGLAISEDQKTSLNALNGELGTKLADLTEKQALLLTDERRAAREAAYKEARESGKDRQATADAVESALNMTAAEKAQLAEVEQSLRELNQQIRERMMALLTPEQKTELEKRFGDGRRRE
jgi:Spy/CpxP family protein refolding chaperone